MFSWIKNKINKKLKREHRVLVGQNKLFYETCVYTITGIPDDYDLEDATDKQDYGKLLTFLHGCEEKVNEIVSKGDPPYSNEDAGVLLDINGEYMKIYMEDTYGLFPGSYLESFPDKFTPLEFKLNLDDENK